MATLQDLLNSGISRDEINAILSQSSMSTDGFQQSAPQPDIRQQYGQPLQDTLASMRDTPQSDYPTQRQTMAQFFANPQPEQPIQQPEAPRFTVGDDGLSRMTDRPGVSDQATMNSIRNNTTGVVTQMPTSRQGRSHDVWADGPQVLHREQMPDGRTLVTERVPAMSDGRQSVGMRQRIETPDYLNPAMLAKQKYEKGAAEIDQMRAKPQGDQGTWSAVESNGKQYLINNKTGAIKPAEVGGEQLSGKSTEKPMTEAQRAKFEQGFANDYQTVGQTIETMSNIKKAIADIKESKGLDYREGLSGYIPPILQGENARTAENRIQTLKGKVTQMGKAMASMAGAIGPMAVQEWKIVSDAVNAIDPTAGNFQEQLSNIENQTDGAINRIQDKYERQYVDRFEKYPQFKREGGAAPTSPSADPGYEAWKKRNGKS